MQERKTRTNDVFEKKPNYTAKQKNWSPDWKQNHATIVRTPIQDALNNLILLEAYGYMYYTKIFEANSIQIQALINDDPHCIYKPDSAGNSTLHYLSKLRKVRWQALNSHYMNLIIQICDTVEEKYFSKLFDLYLCMKNMDNTFTIPIPVVDIILNIFQFTSQLQTKKYDENFKQFIALLKNYFDPNNTDFTLRNHTNLVNIKALQYATQKNIGKTSFCSDLGTGKILFELNKHNINPNDKLADIIRFIQKKTGYNDTHFKDRSINMNALFANYENYDNPGYLLFRDYNRDSLVCWILESYRNDKERNSHIELFLNAGLITSSDIVSYFMMIPGYYFSTYGMSKIDFSLFAKHCNALNKNEIEDILVFLLEKRNYKVIDILFENLKNKNTLEICKHNLLQCFLNECNRLMTTYKNVTEIINIIKLLIQVEPRCVLQLQDYNIKDYFCNSKNGYDHMLLDLDVLIKQTILELEQKQKPQENQNCSQFTNITLFSRQETCQNSHQNANANGVRPV